MGAIQKNASRPTRQRLVAENCFHLSVAEWNRSGYCKPGSDVATIVYKFIGGKRVKITQKIAWTSCNYGGQRPWFVCPKCEQRSGKLFLRVLLGSSIDGAYQCRRCLGLTYASSNASGNFQKEWDLECRRIGRKLKAPENFHRESLKDFRSMGLLPEPPKGMHYRTYRRLAEKLRKSHQRFFLGQLKKVQKSYLRLKRITDRSISPEERSAPIVFDSPNLLNL